MKNIYLRFFILFLVFGQLACSRDEFESSNVDVPELTDPDNREVKTLTLYSWDEYFSLDLFDEFEQRFGTKIVYEKYENTDEVFLNLRTKPGAYDVIVLDDVSMKRARAMRLLRPLDHDRVPNIQNIDPDFVQKATYDPGLKFSVPYMWGTTLLAYRKDLVENVEESWSVLLESKFKGKISLLEERMECFATALRISGSHMNSRSPEDLSKAKDVLGRIVTEQEAKFGSDNDMKRHLIEGDSHIAMMYSGDAALIAEEHEIGFFIPSEGATRWTDSFAISRDSPSVNRAHDFINFMAEAEVAAQSSNDLWYATPNLAAFKHEALNEELRNDSTIYPNLDVMKRCEFLDDGDESRIRVLNGIWDQVYMANNSDEESE